MVAGVAVGIVLVVGGLLWYYQQQGILKIFPTAEDQQIKKLLTIDRSKFHAPQGLSQDKFEEEIKKLEEQKQAVLANTKDGQAWFSFGYTKEFLNDHAGAAAVWEKAFELQPYNFMFASNLANDYQYFLKDYPKAEYYYLKVLELQPGSSTAFTGLSDLYRFNWKAGQDKLEPMLLEAVKKDSASAVSYYTTLVEFFASAGNLDKAKTYLAEVAKLKPEAATQLEQSYPGLK